MIYSNPSYPSVTTVLKKYQDFSRVRPEDLDLAAKRGTIVHHYASVLARGQFPLLTQEQLTIPKTKEFCGSFELWFDKHVERVLLVEERLTSEKWGFTGQPDLIVIMKGETLVTLPDIKTPQVSDKLWIAQMAAYQELIEEATAIRINKVGSLKLRPDGRMALMQIYSAEELTSYWNAFLNALYAHKFFYKGDPNA